MGEMPQPAQSPAIRAVLFDYGLVLSGPPDPSAWQTMKQILHADEDAFHAAYWGPRHDYDSGHLNGNTYWQHVAHTLGRTLSHEEHQALLEADIDLWTQPNHAMIDWARQLQVDGVRTGILSNIGDAMEHGILARCPWVGDFAHHTFSHRLLTAKPDPAIYAYAARGLATEPSQILFIDDRAENIEAARAAGMQAIQYTSHETFLRAMHEAGYDGLLPSATNV